MDKDLYEILGISKKATKSQIKKAYRRLARKYHPDLNPGDKKAEEMFKQISQAYSVLSNKEKRKQYDEMGSGFFSQAGAGAPDQGFHYKTYRTPTDSGNVDFDFFSNFQGFGDVFSSMFSQERSSPRERVEYKPHRGKDINEEISVDFKTAVKGGYTYVTIRIREGCELCSGHGNIGGRVCQQCQGAGVIVKSERIRAKIPEGVYDGATLRIKEKGMTGSSGGPRGDLFLKVKVRSHNYYERKGDDIYANLPVTISEAYCGSDVTVSTIHGLIKLKVPRRTQNGTLIRVRGKGVKNLKTNTYGDHFCRIQIMLPDSDSEVAKDITRRLNEYYSMDVRAVLPDSL